MHSNISGKHEFEGVYVGYKELDENFFRVLMKEYLANVRSVNKNNENVQNYIKEEVEETMEDPKITNNEELINALFTTRFPPTVG